MRLRALVLLLAVGLAGCSSGDADKDKAAPGGAELPAAPLASPSTGQSVAEAWKAFCDTSKTLDVRRLSPMDREGEIWKGRRMPWEPAIELSWLLVC